MREDAVMVGALGLAQRVRFKPFFAPLGIQPSVCQLPLEMVSLMTFFFLSDLLLQHISDSTIWKI
jgi:hypothetical protein